MRATSVPLGNARVYQAYWWCCMLQTNRRSVLTKSDIHYIDIHWTLARLSNNRWIVIIVLYNNHLVKMVLNHIDRKLKKSPKL